MISEEALERAKERGAHAMFGEKYGNHVRVVEIPIFQLNFAEEIT